MFDGEDFIWIIEENGTNIRMEGLGLLLLLNS